MEHGTARLEDLAAEGLGALELPADTHQVAQLAGLARLVHEWGSRINLTAHADPEAILRRLVLDAAALFAAAPPARAIADLGSGAGFPGLPLAILAPDVPVTLVEARTRRHHFQRAACRELEIANARPVLGRAEQLTPSPHDLVVAQALAAPAQALAWMLPWAARGGHLLIPGTPASPPRPESVTGRIHGEILHYSVPLGGPERTLWRARVA